MARAALEPRITVTPTGLLDVRFDSAEALLRFDDEAASRLGIDFVDTDRETGLLRDTAPGLDAIAAEFLGRSVEPIVHIEAMYPFDWSFVLRDAPDIDTGLLVILDGLPGELSNVGWWWFGTNDKRPPHLWGSVEPTGLLLGGSLPLPSWNAWREAFEQKTRHMPMRAAGW